MKSYSKVKLALAAFTILLPFVSRAAEPEERWAKNNTVFFRGAYSRLIGSRGGDVFTDSGGATTLNDGKGGFSVGAGLDLGLMKPGQILGIASLGGELFVEFSRFSAKSVTQTTSVLLGAPATSRVNVTELNVGVNPKLRFDSLGRFRPYLIPVGVAFLVSSPPSNDSTYLDLGLNFGGGVEYQIVDWLSLGVDARYALGFGMNNAKTSYFSTGGLVGIHF